MSHYLVNQLVHVMWSTLNQQFHFQHALKSDLLAYITALAKSKNGKVLATGGSTDHIHLLLVLPPDIALGTFMSHLKAYSSKWIKSCNSVDQKFCWQEGYLAMSTDSEKIDSVCRYIKDDEIRHQSKSYSEEVLSILSQQNMEFNKDYFLRTSFAKILVHAIWSTNNRIPCLDKCMRQNLYNQLSDVIANSKGVTLEIGGVEDHVHILMEAPKSKSLSDLIRDIKTISTHWLKSKSSKYDQFEWQTGYAAYTVSYSNIEIVRNYIQNQEEHHLKQTYKQGWEFFNGVN